MILYVVCQEENQDATEAFTRLLPKASSILSLLKERGVDDKVYVRKNALQLLFTIVKRNSHFLTKELLKLFGDSCRDVALLIRRHTTQMLLELVASHEDNLTVKQVMVVVIECLW